MEAKILATSSSTSSSPPPPPPPPKPISPLQSPKNRHSRNPNRNPRHQNTTTSNNNSESSTSNNSQSNSVKNTSPGPVVSDGESTIGLPVAEVPNDPGYSYKIALIFKGCCF